MASKECSQTAQVLLVGSQTLPVLLQSESQEANSDISVDLIQQALQGASGIGDDEEDVGSSAEVNLDAISSNDNDVVAIYQGEEGTHTIKISLAEAESLGLHFSNDSLPSVETDVMENSLKENSESNDVTDNQAISMSNFLHSVTCANIASQERLVDVDGNMIQTSEELQVLPSSLGTLLEGGLNQSITIIPQYGLDGSVTYAVKLKDQDGNVLGPDYHIMEPDSSAKTGLDIEEELTHSTLKQDILHAADPVSLSSSVSLSHGSESSTLSVPVTTLGSLSNHMLLPVSSSTVPISIETPVALSIPAENPVGSSSPAVSSVMNVSQSSSNPSRFFRLMPDRSMSIGNLISAGPSSLSVNSLIAHPISVNQQSSSVVGQPSTSQTVVGKIQSLNGASMTSVSSLGNSKNISLHKPRLAVSGGRLSSVLSTSPYSPVSAMKKMPVSIATPTTSIISPVPAPAMASVAPNTTQPSIGGASTSKYPSSVGQVSSSSNSSKPLGSSENPIQLVQQGQTFHSMQALSHAQLRQIATVLQQKHLNSNPTSTKNILFDEQTKTRIVYRVVYPEDVDLQQPTSPIDKNVNGGSENADSNINKTKRKRGRRKESVEKSGQRTTPSGNRSLLTDVKKHPSDDDQTSDSFIRAEKKKVLGSRTRSGRVSRPPKHMMKDYKRLHHLDYHEVDADDSDGGYSDYNSAEPIPDALSQKEPEPEINPSTIGITNNRKKASRFSCPTCHKLYLGHGRMEKHFNRFPDHGSIEEFKQSLSTPTATNISEGKGNELKSPVPKFSGVRGKRRGQWAQRSEKERSESRKKKLKQALKACEISEIMEVAGPLITQYYSLWELLLLRLFSKDKGNEDKEISEINEELSSLKERGIDESDTILEGESSSLMLGEKSKGLRAKSNRVQWLLMELSSLVDILQSLAGELFQPAHIHENDCNRVEINEKIVSEMFGVSRGIYTVNEQSLLKQMNDLTAGRLVSNEDDTTAFVAKRMRIKEECIGSPSEKGNDIPDCSEVLPSLDLITKASIGNDTDKAMLEKLTEDIPFLNSSDDMICDGEDPDMPADVKDCDLAAGLKVVDEIVNERLKNLSDNINFSVGLQNDLESSALNGEHSDLRVITAFDEAESSMSVNDQSVISSSLVDSSKPSVSVSNMDLINSYSMSSLSPTGPMSQDVSIPSAVQSSDLSNALEPVSSQGMLGGFPLSLSNLGPYDSLQSESSPITNTSHSADSFLDTLTSFETPLTETCSSSAEPISSFSDTVQLNTAPSEAPRPPPKFISSFTPAITNDKQTAPITTAQRLQRSYLALDSGLDVGLDADLDFEAFTEEFNRTAPNATM